MDKYDLLLDLVEHHDKYSSQRIDEILSDPDTREFYNILCKCAASCKANNVDADVNAEWDAFSREHYGAVNFTRFGSRAAAIFALVLTSIAALAIGVVITVNFAQSKKQNIDAAIDSIPSAIVPVKQEAATEGKDSTSVVPEGILFEDETLGAILETVAAHHKVAVDYHAPNVAQLRLYYKFDPSLPLADVLEQLNTFEQIDIKVYGDTLIVY